MTWISVKDRLPEYDMPVLACDTIITVVAVLDSVGGFHEAYGDCEDIDATHWMPLPDPPAAE